MKLSILDQSPVLSGKSSAEALHATIELARVADRLGYTRYWLAEHHNSATLADASPEILIPVVASNTSRIRVGSGGVMLSHYSPLKVAETFRMLATLFPGRIDMGLGRAPGSDRITAAALQTGPVSFPIESYPEQVADLLRFHANSVPDGHRFNGIHATPTGPDTAAPWLLASSYGSVSYAAVLGLPLSFAHFIADSLHNQLSLSGDDSEDSTRAQFGVGPELVRWYRDNFQPSEFLTEPLVNVGVSAVCADSTEEAQRLGFARHLMRLRRDQGRPLQGVPSAEELATVELSESERRLIEVHRDRAIEGDAARVRDRLEQLAGAYETDELIILTITPTYESRTRSYELLADTFGLGLQTGN
ncbi:MAG: LLM class flavin-dependent oxidoreductase [Chloroflexi bacterium]|nr:LLM class flavin-dependent oxidoreductase [Chloroflexota bacterium]